MVLPRRSVPERTWAAKRCHFWASGGYAFTGRSLLVDERGPSLVGFLQKLSEGLAHPHKTRKVDLNLRIALPKLTVEHVWIKRIFLCCRSAVRTRLGFEFFDGGFQICEFRHR